MLNDGKRIDISVLFSLPVKLKKENNLQISIYYISNLFKNKEKYHV